MPESIFTDQTITNIQKKIAEIKEGCKYEIVLPACMGFSEKTLSGKEIQIIFDTIFKIINKERCDGYTFYAHFNDKTDSRSKWMKANADFLPVLGEHFKEIDQQEKTDEWKSAEKYLNNILFASANEKMKIEFNRALTKDCEGWRKHIETTNASLPQDKKLSVPTEEELKRYFVSLVVHRLLWQLRSKDTGIPILYLSTRATRDSKIYVWKFLNRYSKEMQIPSLIPINIELIEKPEVKTKEVQKPLVLTNRPEIIEPVEGELLKKPLFDNKVEFPQAYKVKNPSTFFKLATEVAATVINNKGPKQNTKIASDYLIEIAKILSISAPTPVSPINKIKI